MPRLRAALATLLALAVVVATPLSSLASCMRCPPDCPMHARDGGHDPHGGGDDVHPHDDGHAAHAAIGGHHHAESGEVRTLAARAAAAGAPDHDDCHARARAARARAEGAEGAEGPCLTAACGHHAPVIASVLPDGVVSSVGRAAPRGDAGRVAIPPLAAVAADPTDPPTEPPRPLLG